MYELIDEYLNQRPSEVIPILEITIPCGSECISKSRYQNLLTIEAFKSQLEVIDSLKDLISYKITNLLDDIKEKLNEPNVDINALAYSIYKIVEYGGDYQIGIDDLKFEERKIYSGNFNDIMRVNKKIESLLSDKNIKAICDEIRNLADSLWVHFDKNIRRVLNEVQGRS